MASDPRVDKELVLVDQIQSVQFGRGAEANPQGSLGRGGHAQWPEVYTHAGCGSLADDKAMKGDMRAIKTIFEMEKELGLDKPQGRSGVLKVTRVPPELRKQWAEMQQAKFRGEDPEGLAALDANLPESERGRY